jgi:predicted O-linked N-acetylglucosamine transferase (SPINDLY family)
VYTISSSAPDAGFLRHCIVTVHSDNIFKRAMALLHGGKIDEAERAFRGLLKEEPRHVGALNLLSIVMVQQGKFAKAEPFIKRALDESPSSDATLYNYGIVLKALNRPDEALERFNQALAINPAVAETWNSRGTVFNELGRYQQAIADFDKALSIDPKLSAAYCNKGKPLGVLKSYDQALVAFDRALQLNPGMTEAWGGRGNILNDLKRYDNALAAFDRALSLNPNSAESWSGRGGALLGLNRIPEALAAYDKALSLNSKFSVAWIGRGNVYEKIQQLDEAAAAYERAITLTPDHAGAWLGRGNINFKQHKLADASADYNKAFVLEPDFAEALIGLGNVLNKQGLFDQALREFDKALALHPNHAHAWQGCGNVYFNKMDYADALAAYNRALVLEPDFAEALTGRGNVFTERQIFDRASDDFDKALSLQPNLAEAWQGCGNIHLKRKQYAEAFAAYDKAFSINPALNYLEGIRLHTKQFICDWSSSDTETSRLLSAVREQRPASLPLVLLSTASSSADQLQCARCYVGRQPSYAPHWRAERYSRDRVRIAYVSSDLREHPLARLMAEVFEQHDKSLFEITAISLGSAQESAVRARIKASIERFVDTQAMEDDQIADFIREHEIDILVDLNGHTEGARHGVLARRPAPIQINYLGFPGTTGAEYIDYIIADRTVIPAADQHNFSEKIIYMPDSFQANDRKGHTIDKVFTRAQAGLPPEGFVFCCFNTNYKITPEVFELWSRILRQVEGAVLWLYAQNPTAQNNLIHESEKRGIAAERLIFAPRLSLPEHQSRLPLADLFLDTLPFNAGATASGVISAGVPVLTRMGNTFSGRMGASLLNAIGLPDLITSTAESYVTLAVELATQPGKIAAIKRKLADSIGSTPLFDTQRFTRHLESAYLTIHARQQCGDPPDTFDVERLAPAGIM